MRVLTEISTTDFFNGYSKSQDILFSLALGIYPHLNVKDAAFCLVYKGKQYNLRTSSILHMERMDIRHQLLAVREE